MANVPDCGATEFDGGGNFGEVAAGDGDICRCNSNIGSGAQSDSYIGLGKSGCIIDAITYHGDDLTLLLQRFNSGGLLVRTDLSDDMLDSNPFGDGMGGAGMVSR